MGLNIDGNHRSGYNSYTVNEFEQPYLANNSQIQNIFNENGTLNFQIDGSKQGIIYSKGDHTNINDGCSFIANEQGYLVLILFENNGVNRLVYKSTTPVIKTKERKLYSIRWNNTTKLAELLINSLPVGFIVSDTSLAVAGTSRNSASEFTALHTNTAILRHNSSVSNNLVSEFTEYYYNYKNTLQSQESINTLWNLIKDSRTLTPNGRILFTSDREGDDIYRIYSMDVDGDDAQLVLDSSENLYYPKYNKNAGNYTEFTFTKYNNGIWVKKANEVAYKLGDSNTVNNIHSFGSSFNNSGHILFSNYDNNIYTIANQNLSDNSISFLNIFTSNADIENFPEVFNNDDNIIIFCKTASTTPASLLKYNINTQQIDILYQLGTVGTSGGSYVQKPRVNSDNTKIGFTVLLDLINPSACIINADGTGFTVLESNAYFEAFTDTNEFIYSKKMGNNKFQLHKRNFSTNAVKNISNNNFNDIFADYKA